MEVFKKYFESSLIVPKQGACYRLVFGRIQRNGHFRCFVSGVQFDYEDDLENQEFYDNVGLVDAVEQYTNRVVKAAASIEGWLI